MCRLNRDVTLNKCITSSNSRSILFTIRIRRTACLTWGTTLLRPHSNNNSSSSSNIRRLTADRILTRLPILTAAAAGLLLNDKGESQRAPSPTGPNRN